MPRAPTLGWVALPASGATSAGDDADRAVHNGVKRANIFASPDGSAKIGDFGLASQQGR